MNFKSIEKLAFKVKFSAQMIIGLVLFLLLCKDAFFEIKTIIFDDTGHIPDLQFPLKIVSYGLGISAGIDMSLHLVSRVANKDLAYRTAKQMEFEWTQNS